MESNHVETILICYDPTNNFSNSYAHGVSAYAVLAGIEAFLYTSVDLMPRQPSTHTAYLILFASLTPFNDFGSLLPTVSSNMLLLSDLTDSLVSPAVQLFIEQTPLSREFQNYVPDPEYYLTLQTIFPRTIIPPYISYFRFMLCLTAYLIQTFATPPDIRDADYIDGILWTPGHYNRIATYIGYAIRFDPHFTLVPQDFYQRVSPQQSILGVYTTQ